MSVCLCLVVSGKLDKPSRVYYPEAGVMFPPDVLVTCVVSADSVTGLETERTPRTEQGRGATKRRKKRENKGKVGTRRGRGDRKKG